MFRFEEASMGLMGVSARVDKEPSDVPFGGASVVVVLVVVCCSGWMGATEGGAAVEELLVEVVLTSRGEKVSASIFDSIC